jgi:hypothetical protein
MDENRLYLDRLHFHLTTQIRMHYFLPFNLKYETTSVGFGAYLTMRKDKSFASQLKPSQAYLTPITITYGEHKRTKRCHIGHERSQVVENYDTKTLNRKEIMSHEGNDQQCK